MGVKAVRNAKIGTRGSRVSRPENLLLEEQEFLDPFALGSWTPPVDICETENLILVRVELPGVSHSDFRLTFQRESLRIQGTKREQGGSNKLLCYYCLERRYGRFDRQIAVKGFVNPRQARAVLENGILTVEIPRLKDRRGEPVEIPVELK